MNVHTCRRMTRGLATVVVVMLLASACGPAPSTFRAPNLNELQAFAKDKGLTPIADELFDGSVLFLCERGESFGLYTLTVRESDGAVVESGHVSAAKSADPILILGPLTGDQPFLAVVIQDPALLAETTAIEVGIDSQNRLTATTHGQAGVILVPPLPIDRWQTVTLYDAQGQVLYSQEGQ